ncbi:MAG: tRNA pseudouridine(38-40) synthase TruA [Bacteroidota bacterium]
MSEEKEYQKYFLEFSYIGTNYHGWQIQKNGTSVQQYVNEKLSTILREDITTMGSSRTDAGVHARQNFLHFETIAEIENDFLRKLNFLLPRDIAVRNIFKMGMKCHARFDAISRSYEYVLSYEKNPFIAETACFYPYYKLDVNILNDFSQLLFEHKDYAAFSKRRTTVKTTICTISQAEWKVNAEKKTITFYVSSNRFLRGMVRGLVATIIAGGRQKLSKENFIKLLNSSVNQKTDFSAPANGLTLTAVKYPEGYFPEPLIETIRYSENNLKE